MKLELVLTERSGEVLCLDPRGLSRQVQSFLGAVTGGAIDLEGGAATVALDRHGKSVDVPAAVGRELAAAVGRDGTFLRVELRPQARPPKPRRQDFAGDEVAYFRAAATYHQLERDSGSP